MELVYLCDFSSYIAFLATELFIVCLWNSLFNYFDVIKLRQKLAKTELILDSILEHLFSSICKLFARVSFFSFNPFCCILTYLDLFEQILFF